MEKQLSILEKIIKYNFKKKSILEKKRLFEIFGLNGNECLL